MTNYKLGQLKDKLEDYLQSMGLDTSKRAMDCPICGDKGGFGFVPDTDHQLWHCFSGKHSSYPSTSGNIFELVQQLENTDFKGALEILKDKYVLGNDYTPQPRKPVQPLQTSEEEKEYKQFEAQWLGNTLVDAQKYAMNSHYLLDRGISVEVQQRFGIGFIPNFVHPKTLWNHRNEPNYDCYSSPRVIIPTSSTSLLARAINKSDEGKNSEYKVLKVGSTHVFNADILTQDVGYCFIFEGEIDALSAIELRYNAVGIGSTSMLNRLFKEYEINPNNVLIIAMDNDQGGQESIQKAINLCKMHKIPCVLADVDSLYLGKKDANDALRQDRQAFANALLNEVEKAKNFDITQYMATCAEGELSTRNPQKATKTYSFDYMGQINRAFDISCDVLRYCNQNKAWYVFDGVRLERDVTEKFIDNLHKHIDSKCKKELDYFQTKDNAELLKSAKKEHKIAISKVGLLNAVDGIKRREPIAITLLELDRPNLLNCENITLNLDTLEPHQHNIEDLCTKLANAVYGVELNQNFVALWNKFLNDIMCGDIEMVEFLQRVCGYSLFPYNKEECFFILYGATTRNGKSTLLESIKAVLGDYAKAVSSATLSERPTGKDANPEIIDLIGAKLIICGELNSETLLNDTLLKSWIGNDTISARHLFDNNVLNFKLDGKLYANCNELPPMKNDDLLNSNRVVVIPFDRHFEEHEQDKDLKRIFATDEFRAVILAWLVDGYRKYLQLGIKAHMPERVRVAIDNYQSEANSINVFLSDEDVFERIDVKNYADAVKINDKRLYVTYTDWCLKNGCKPLSSANFKKQLRKNRNYSGDSEKKQNGVRYKNILISYKLRPSVTFTDMSQPDNPDRLVTLSQRELDRSRK